MLDVADRTHGSGSPEEAGEWLAGLGCQRWASRFWRSRPQRRTGSLSASPLLQWGANEPAGVHLPWECGRRVAASHASAARWQRRRAPPIILFKRLRVGGVAKGFPAFQGFGVIERAELIAQYDARQGCSFPNYVFDIAVFDAALTLLVDWIAGADSPESNRWWSVRPKCERIEGTTSGKHVARIVPDCVAVGSVLT